MGSALQKREYWLDLVKGVVIIGVVLQHSLQSICLVSPTLSK